MRMRKRVLIAGACAVAGLVTAAHADEKVTDAKEQKQAQATQGTPAAAQSAPGTSEPADSRKVERVVVTATRREADIQKVPGAVTAWGSGTIDTNRLNDAKDFVQLLPNALFEEGSFNINASISIRGIRPGQDISEPGFGYYRDGHYMGGLRTNFSDLLDLERVEVLRGPQGGLYGRNAVGGAVNFIYRQPDLENKSGYAEVSYGSYDRYEARAIANLPIVEGELAARINAWFVDQTEGQFHNITLGEDVDTYKSSGGRASLKWKADDDFSVVWQVERQSQSGPEVVGVQPGLGETDETIVADSPSKANKDWTFVSQNAVWDTSIGQVSLLASYRNYQLQSLADQDGGANPALKQLIRRYEDDDAYYVSAQWLSRSDQRLTWVAGVDFFHEDFGLVRPVTCDGGSCTFSLAQTQFDLPTDSIAVFGEATFQLTDTLSLIGSARYNQDEKELNLLRRVFNPAGVLITSVPVQDSATFENTSFGAGVQWLPNDNLNFYFRANEGFRAGGYNTGISSASFDINRLPFNEETSVNYEIGAKTAWLDGKLIVNLALFRLYQDNLQGFVPDAFFNFFVENVGESETDGVEVELAAQVTENLLVTFGYGWIDGELTGGADFSGSLAGKGILFGNGQNWNLNGVYRHPIANETDLVLQASWRQNDPDFAGVPIFFIGDVNTFNSYSLVDASVAVEGEDWRIRLFGTNLTDERYILSQAFFNPFGPGTLINFNQDRRFGVEASVSF